MTLNDGICIRKWYQTRGELPTNHVCSYWITLHQDTIMKYDVLPNRQICQTMVLKPYYTYSAWTPEDEEDAKAMLASELLPGDDLCLFVSALTLSLMECFDLRKIMWLLDSY